MIKPFFLPLLLFVFAGNTQQTKSTINIIPQPLSVKQGKGNFVLNKRTVIVAKDEADRKSAAYLNAYLQQVYGFRLDIDRKEGNNYIRLSTKSIAKPVDTDAYTLEVKKEGVTIEGTSYAGTFYGTQTLIQLLPLKKTAESSDPTFIIPFVSIQDQPRFHYRGMHLDVGRHMFPVDFIKSTLITLHFIK
jgi:hexosaminidase